MSGVCGMPLPSTAHAELGPWTRRVAGCVAALALALSSAGIASAAATPRRQPQQLWRAYPLDPARTGETRTNLSSRATPSPLAGDGTSGGGSTSILIAVGAATLLVAGSVAALALRRLRAGLSIRTDGAGSIRAPWLLSRPPKGGSTMANLRFGKPARREPEVSAPLQKGGSKDHGPTEAALHAESLEETEREAVAVEAELPADFSDVGAEVGAVLNSARDAAARIRKQAALESIRLGDEARATAQAAIEEALRIAAEDRAEGERIRAEAESYAGETRADAESFAERTRTDAGREAGKIVEEARTRLEAADAEAAQKVRDLTADARERLSTLQAASKRYEERLEHMLVVFRGMSSRLEELLGERADGSEADEETLEDALQPDSVSSHTE